MGGNGNQADIRITRSQFPSAAGWCGIADLVALAQITAPGLVLEVPHQRSRIEEMNRRHTNAAFELAGHSLVYLGTQR
jgi:hypothetical protein